MSPGLAIVWACRPAAWEHFTYSHFGISPGSLLWDPMPAYQSFSITQQESLDGKSFNPMPSIATGPENKNVGGVALRPPKIYSFHKNAKEL